MAAEDARPCGRGGGGRGCSPVRSILVISFKLKGNISINVVFQVLPRQICGLFTHTVLLDKYPKGPEKLEESVFGGTIFQLLINNPVRIFKKIYKLN